MSTTSLQATTAGMGSSLYAIGEFDAFRPEHLPESSIEKSSFSISIENVVVTALIFFSILAWFDFLRGSYETVFFEKEDAAATIAHIFFYAIFVTALSIILTYMIYKVGLKKSYV
jgi:hypothetical protein